MERGKLSYRVESALLGIFRVVFYIFYKTMNTFDQQKFDRWKNQSEVSSIDKYLQRTISLGEKL